MARIARLALAAVLCLLVSACSTLGYYLQAVDGHLQLMARTRPIPDLIGDAATPPELRQQLEHAGAIRDFAVRELALPDNHSYRSYANLGRPFVVWNVFAAPEFSLELQQWCMLFIGCVNYRGYSCCLTKECYSLGKCRCSSFLSDLGSSKAGCAGFAGRRA